MRNRKGIVRYWCLILTVFILFLPLLGCEGKMKVVDMKQFEGKWKLVGRPMYEGIVVDIKATKQHRIVGEVIKLNDNKWTKMFVDTGDVWIKNIIRLSNFQFEIIENRIAHDLFAIYGEKTTQHFRTQFIDKNTFGLGKKNDDLTISKVKYVRVK